MSFFNANFFSESLGICVTANILLPQSTRAQIGLKGKGTPDGCPVLYLLHGLSDDHSIWMRRTSIERYASQYGIAVVMPNGHRSYYSDMKNGMKYWTYVSEELPEFIRSVFKFSTAPEDTYVAGLSMGGFGAMKLALNKPGCFDAAASFSGAMIAGTACAPCELENIQGGDFSKDTINDLFAAAEKNAKEGVRMPALFLSCGTEDGLYPVNLRFRDHLKKLNIPFTWSEGPGNHSWDVWDANIQQFLKFIGERRAGR